MLGSSSVSHVRGGGHARSAEGVAYHKDMCLEDRLSPPLSPFRETNLNKPPLPASWDSSLLVFVGEGTCVIHAGLSRVVVPIWSSSPNGEAEASRALRETPSPQVRNPRPQKGRR